MKETAPSGGAVYSFYDIFDVIHHDDRDFGAGCRFLGRKGDEGGSGDESGVNRPAHCIGCPGADIAAVGVG